jgi:hypothetical protein
MADFKTLRGNRVLLNIPKKEEGKLIVDENTKEALEKEITEKLNKLTVYAVGDLVTDIKAGDEVFVDPTAIRTRAFTIPIGDDRKMLVSPFDIVIVW